MKGQKISDRYQIMKSIGEGGMANVYLAYDTILDRDVAVKILRGDLSGDEKFVRRFQREALSASSLTHPNIVEVYDVGEDHGMYYIVMEYIEGRHLKDLIKKRGKLTVSEVIDIMLQITDGMSVAHDSYIIHRDIKPQNIMILENGLVKITDFGISMAMNATQLTQTNSVMGSVHYLPPEQASGKGSSLQSDIYSMGIVMYELLAGKLPYKGDNAVEIALKHLKEPLPSIKDEIPSCLDESRAKEPKIELPYPENIDDTKITKVLKNAKPEEKKKDDVNEEDEIIARQITQNDLKKDNKIIIILASIFTFLVVAITTVVLLVPALTTNKEILIPDVTNQTVEEAIKTLQDAGFNVATDQQPASSDEIPFGNIVKTSPLAGTKRTKGTQVTLFVSEGDAKVTLENYVGQNYLEIKGKLEALGVQVIIEKKDAKSTAEENIIIEQSPLENEKVSKGDYVTLYIPEVDKYPDFTNGSYTYDDVVAFLEKYDVKVTKVEEETSSKNPGVVLKQSRAKGTRIVGGTSITVTVAKKPEKSSNNNNNDENNNNNNNEDEENRLD